MLNTFKYTDFIVTIHLEEEQNWLMTGKGSVCEGAMVALQRAVITGF